MNKSVALAAWFTIAASAVAAPAVPTPDPALPAVAASDTQRPFAFDWNPRSGDAWVDQRLDDINRYGVRYRAPFIDEIVRYYDAPRALVSDLIVRQGWAPGDVYYACAVARIVASPCRAVAEAWSRDHEAGWREVAQTIGIAPGSDAFHRLKQGFVATYDRWARPIPLDAELQGDFPDRSPNGAKRSLDSSTH